MAMCNLSLACAYMAEGLGYACCWTGEAEREAVLRTVAAVLHLGNITLVGAADEGAAPRDSSAEAALAAVADLLQVCAKRCACLPCRASQHVIFQKRVTCHVILHVPIALPCRRVVLVLSEIAVL